MVRAGEQALPLLQVLPPPLQALLPLPLPLPLPPLQAHLPVLLRALPLLLPLPALLLQALLPPQLLQALVPPPLLLLQALLSANLTLLRPQPIWPNGHVHAAPGAAPRNHRQRGYQPAGCGALQ